jgi:hypothetical protein
MAILMAFEATGKEEMLVENEKLMHRHYRPSLRI